MTKKDKKTYLIPMEVTRETIKAYGIKKEDVVPAKIGNKIVSAIMSLFKTVLIRLMWSDLNLFTQPLSKAKKNTAIFHNTAWL